MSRLQLTMACGPYDLMGGLIDASIAPPGIDLNVLTMASPERHRRMLRSATVANLIHEAADLGV